MRAWPVARSIFDAPYVREANERTTSWIRQRIARQQFVSSSHFFLHSSSPLIFSSPLHLLSCLTLSDPQASSDRVVKPVRRACARGSKFGQDASLTHVCSVAWGGAAQPGKCSVPWGAHSATASEMQSCWLDNGSREGARGVV